MLSGMGREDLIPAKFHNQHPKYKTPYIANIFCALVTLVGPFLGSSVLDPLTTLGSTGFIVGWGIVCLSFIWLAGKEFIQLKNQKTNKFTAGLGAVFCALLFINGIIPGMPGYMGTAGMMAFVIWALLGVLFYKVRASSLRLRTETKKNQ